MDTGAGQSAIQLDFCKKVKSKIVPQGQNPKSLITAAGHTVPIAGTAIINVEIAGVELPFKFLVVKELCQRVILGLDFLEQNEAIINCSEGTISFHNSLSIHPIRTKQDCMPD